MPHASTLASLLNQLRLPGMASHWEEDAQCAQAAHWSYPEYLNALCNKELAGRQEKRIARYIKEARLPLSKTLDTFNFKTLPSVNPAQITTLAEDSGWVDRAENLILFGPSGVGKTHIASAIAYRLIEKGVRIYFSSTTAMVQHLQKAQQEYRLPEALLKLARYPLLILDDIGYAKKDQAQTSVLFELIADRYESGSLMITSNQPFGEWDQIFPDNVMAVAAIDRLVHHATIISIEGESYRKAHHQAQVQQQK